MYSLWVSDVFYLLANTDNLIPMIFRILSEAMDQEEFPKFIKTRNIEILGLDRASIKSIPPNMCTHLSRLKSW